MIKEFTNHNVFFLKNNLFRQKAMKEYKLSLGNQLLSKDEIINLNFKKRTALLKHAYYNVPFYNKFYKENYIDPKLFDNYKYWDKIPVVEKKFIRDNRKNFLSNGVGKSKLIKTTTGGSTGKPLALFRDGSFPEEILQWRMLKRWGISPASNVAQFWRVPNSKKNKTSEVINKIIWWPTKRLSFDVSAISIESMYKLTEQINKLKPKLFWGYVGALEQYARFLEENEMKLSMNPSLVWVTAAPTSMVQRELFNRVFSCGVLDQYACSEIHWVGSNTPDSNNLVLDYDYRHVDIVDKYNQPLPVNVSGDILLTDLHNYAFPLIKYRVGDQSYFINETSETAPGFPMIAPVSGRITDYIKSKNGFILTGEYLTTIFDNYTEIINQFQIHQIDILNVNIKVVFRNDKTEYSDLAQKIIKDLSSKTNDELEFHFIPMKQISNDSGKIKFIINDLLL